MLPALATGFALARAVALMCDGRPLEFVAARWDERFPDLRLRRNHQRGASASLRAPFGGLCG